MLIMMHLTPLLIDEGLLAVYRIQRSRWADPSNYQPADFPVAAWKDMQL